MGDVFRAELNDFVTSSHMMRDGYQKFSRSSADTIALIRDAQPGWIGNSHSVLQKVLEKYSHYDTVATAILRSYEAKIADNGHEYQTQENDNAQSLLDMQLVLKW